MYGTGTNTFSNLESFIILEVFIIGGGGSVLQDILESGG
jgi:hypothetical protein